MSIKYICLRCGKRVRWWQTVIYDDDIYRINTAEGIATYRHRTMIHKKCLSKIEKDVIKQDKKRKKGDKDDSNTTNLDKIYY